jgi:hypothetical protein
MLMMPYIIAFQPSNRVPFEELALTDQWRVDKWLAYHKSAVVGPRRFLTNYSPTHQPEA